jgi:surfeit locus 1 family protein
MQGLPAAQIPFSTDLTAQEYRKIQVTGLYDFQHEFVVRNQFFNGEYGFHLVTPLRLGTDGSTSQENQAVLVDRGWIPADGIAGRSDWAKYDSPGTATVSGVIRKFELPPSWLAATPTSANVSKQSADVAFQMFVEPTGVGEGAPYALLPIYIQAGPRPGVETPPLGTEPALDLTEGPHLGYAIQWFAFSALLLVGYPVYVLRREELEG